MLRKRGRLISCLGQFVIWLEFVKQLADNHQNRLLYSQTVSQTVFLDKIRPDPTRNLSKPAVVNRGPPNYNSALPAEIADIPNAPFGVCAWFPCTTMMALHFIHDSHARTYTIRAGADGAPPTPLGGCGPPRASAHGGPQPPTGRPTGDVGPCRLMSAAGSQHLLRPKTGFRAHNPPSGASKPWRSSKPLLCRSLLVTVTGRSGPRVDFWAHR